MKVLRIVFFSISLLLLFCVPGSAQKDRPIDALPENATLAQTQNWLIQALTQNSSYLAKVDQPVRELGSRTAVNQSGYADTKITEVKFQGSVLTYKINRSIQLNSGGGVSSGSSFPPVPEESNARVQLDLKDIDPNEVTLQEINGDSKSQSLSLRTYDYKRLIRLKSKDTGEISVSIATMMVGGNIAEQVQQAFLHLIKLCQEPKP